MKEKVLLKSLRQKLIRQAYYITGSLDDAEDIVQDAYLQWEKAPRGYVESQEAYLMRTVTNLAINLKERQKRQRAAYFGQWLPEPLSDPADRAVSEKESLSYSLLVLLEALPPKERAVFILKEAFAYNHHEIAHALSITEAYSRKLLSRAKSRLTSAERRSVPFEQQQAFLDRFLHVIWTGDASVVETLLHEDIIAISDGGGKASAGKHPVQGRPSVTKMLLGLYRKFYREVPAERAIISGQPALIYRRDGLPVNCQIFDIDAE